MPLDPDPLVGCDVRQADRSHRDHGLLAYDSVNANAWRPTLKYLEVTGADAVLVQETKLPAGQLQDEAEQAARNSRWNTSLQPCSVSSAGGKSGGSESQFELMWA